MEWKLAVQTLVILESEPGNIQNMKKCNMTKDMILSVAGRTKKINSFGETVNVQIIVFSFLTILSMVRLNRLLRVNSHSMISKCLVSFIFNHVTHFSWFSWKMCKQNIFLLLFINSLLHFCRVLKSKYCVIEECIYTEIEYLALSEWKIKQKHLSS